MEEHCLREAGAGGSNPLTPTIYPFFFQLLSSVVTPLHWNSISQCDWIVTERSPLQSISGHGYRAVSNATTSVPNNS